jgi:hypothetical protein
MRSAQPLPLSFESIHEASHVILAAYVGATNIYVLLHFGKPRTGFTHSLASPGLIMSYAGYAGDRLLSKLTESDCIARSASDGVLRQMILEKMANPIVEAGVCDGAKHLALALVERFRREIYEAAVVIQRSMWQCRSIPAEAIEQLECVARVRALGDAEREIEAGNGQ